MDSQVEEARAYITSKKYALGEGDVFTEVVSGARMDRRAYYELLARIEDGDLKVLVCWDLARLGRNTYDTAYLAAKCKEFGIRVETPTGSTYVIQDPNSKLIFDIMCSIAEWERNSILIRMNRGKKTAHKRGYWVVGETPYGYKAEGPRGAKRLVVEEAQAATVRRIYEAYVAGDGSCTIAKHLTALGVPPPKRGSWRATQVIRILAHPVYNGYLTLNGELVKGVHGPIVSAELWERAAIRRQAQRAIHPGRRRGTGKATIATRLPAFTTPPRPRQAPKPGPQVAEAIRALQKTLDDLMELAPAQRAAFASIATSLDAVRGKLAVT